MTDLINRLQAAYDKVAFAPEQSPTGWIDLIELRNVVGEALIELRTMQRKAEERADRGEA